MHDESRQGVACMKAVPIAQEICMSWSLFSVCKGCLGMQIKPGGHLILFCMSDANKDPYTGPERISKTQLQVLFSV